MKKSITLFGEMENIKEETRKPRLIERRIKSNQMKVGKHNAKVSTKNHNTHVKKPNSFSK